MKTAGGIVAAGLALVLLASTGVDRGDTPTPPAAETVAPTSTGEVDEDGLPPGIPYHGDLEWSCDGSRAVYVTPDNPDARASADRGCLRLDIAISRAPWPNGVRP